MTLIRSRKHAANRYVAAMAVLALPLTLPAAGHAEMLDSADGTTVVTVVGQATPLRAGAVSSPKRTEKLLDTPQTVSVIKKELLSEQGASTLADALRNTPGITMQLGENGNTSTGDTFQLRGFAAQSSLFLDGIRDVGAVSRDTYDIEQVEVAKGPAGSDIGRGASSGYINLVSKLPSLVNASSASASVYAQGGARGTADLNVKTGATSAFRLNLMDQDIDTAGRSYVKNSGYGVAPAYGIGIGTDTRFFIFGQALHQDNVPEGGLPVIGYPGFFNANAAIMAGTKVNRENYYGSPSDYEKVDADMLTARIEHDFATGWYLVNTTRYGQTTMDRVLTGIGTNASSGITIPAGGSASDPSTWIVNRSRQRVDQTNHIIANTTNVTTSFKTGDWTHDIATGVELNYESQDSLTFGTTGLTIPSANLYHPNVNDVLPTPVATGAYADGSTTTVSGYLFDTIKKDKWLFNAGARIDNYSTQTDSVTIATATSNPPLPAGTAIPAHLTKTGTLLSWNVGAVYKPTEDSSLYVAYGNSLTPPGSTNFTLSATASNIGNSAFKPTETDNLEVGAKWDLLHDKLSLTGAWYDTVARNELAQLDPISNTYVQIGKRDVTGIELGLVGQITAKWQISAGLQTLHTEIKTGTTGTTGAGAATRWSPDLTATLWTTYKVTKKLMVGGGLSYVSVQKLVVDPTVIVQTVGLARIPAYTVANAMANYDLTPHVAVQLNIYNLFNTSYINSLNNGGARMLPGIPLTGTLTLNVKF